MWRWMILAGGVLFGIGFGALVYEAVDLITPPRQATSGAAAAWDGAVMGLGLALMLIGSWSRPKD